MKLLQHTLKPIFLAAFWICLSEFVRNEFLLKSFWDSHYQNLGLLFPSSPVNGMIWMIWSVLLSSAIYSIATKFSLLYTTTLSWVMGFVMMWVVLGNLNVLPGGAFIFIAIPLSFFEAFIAAMIIKKFQTNKTL